MNGRLVPAAPGTEVEVIGSLKDAEHGVTKDAVILVGERLAQTHGALSAAADLAAGTGARIAWVPRRAGDRGAVEAGALPNLLPGGRPRHRGVRARRRGRRVGRGLAAGQGRP